MSDPAGPDPRHEPAGSETHDGRPAASGRDGVGPTAGSTPPGWQRLFAELKRRSVFRVAAVYGAVAFVVLQAADILVPAFGLPAGVTRGVVLLLVLGFPVALVLAWAYERTPEGVHRTDPAATGEIARIVDQPRGSRWPIGIAALGGMVLFGFGVWWALGSEGFGDGMGPRALVRGDRADAAAPAGRPDTGGGRAALAADAPGPRHAIAVLPFVTAAGDEEAEVFAFGIHDDLLTQLSGIADLRVTSRTSVMSYAGTGKNVRQIARELGVGTILEGSVRRAEDRVRLNAQLIDASTDEHLWAERYDTTYTAANVFAIQGAITRAIASALEAELSPETEASLAAAPTDDLEALEAYHRGIQAFERRPPTDEEALRHFRRAVELDPEFAPAWAWVVRQEAWRVRVGVETDEERARRALERLRGVAPDHVATHLAEGFYRYYALADFRGAAEALRAALERRPGDVDLMSALGFVLRRLGRWEESTALHERVRTLDPLEGTVTWNLAWSYARQRRYADADSLYGEAIRLLPDNVGLWAVWAEQLARGPGDLERASGLVAGREEATGTIRAVRIRLAVLRGDTDAALRDLERRDPGETEFQFPTSTERAGSAAYHAALIHLRAGDEAASRAWADSLVAEARDAVAARPVPPDGDRFGHAAIARSLLGLGLALGGRETDRAEAIRRGEEAVRIYGYEIDAADGAYLEEDLLQIYLLTGEEERARRQLERLARWPSGIGPGVLRLDPRYDGVRDEPWFQAIVARLEREAQPL